MSPSNFADKPGIGSSTGAGSKKLLLILTGSIAVYKACDLISKLVQSGRYEIEVVASKGALKFIGAPLIEGLLSKRVHTELWEAGAAMEHIHLVRWADLILTYPASADYLNKIAAGIGDSIETALFLAHDFKSKPWWIAPAMNSAMLEHPATKKSLVTLRAWGVSVVESEEGSLACGEIGKGRLKEPADMHAQIQEYFSYQHQIVKGNPRAATPTPTPRAHVVVTAGGTVEPIDGVRVLTNRSTGTTGAAIAEALAEQGLTVSYLHGENAKRPQPHARIQEIAFGSAVNLHDLLFAELELQTRRHDVYLVHAAAVADYSPVDGNNSGKLKSDAEQMTVRLKRNPKIVAEIKSRFPEVKLLAFKLTSETSTDGRQSAIASLFKSSLADVIIHNDATEWQWGTDAHSFHWIESAKDIANPQLLRDRGELAKKIMEMVQNSQNNVNVEMTI